MIGTGPELRLGHNASQYHQLNVVSDAGLTWSVVGTDADLNFDFSGATDGDFSVNSDDLFIDTSTGNVGIGTTSPSTKLQIVDSNAYLALTGATWSDAPTIWFGDDSSYTQGRITYQNNGDYLVFGAGGGTNAMVVANTGNVGIGTTSPPTSFTVANTSIGAGNSYVQFYGVSNNRVDILGSGSIRHTYNGTNERFFLSSNGSNDLGLTADGFSLDSGALALGSDFDVLTNATFISGGTGSISGSEMFFFVGSTSTPAVTFKSTGNVGIGTTSPSSLLHVLGQITVDASNYGRVEYARNGTDIWTAGLHEGDDFEFFRTSGSGNVIFRAGNVGIGTTDPGGALEVNGSTLIGDSSDGLLLRGNGGTGEIIGIDVDSSAYNPLSIRSQAGTQLYLNTDGNVGIGTTSPGKSLHIYNGASGGSPSSLGHLVVEDDTNTGLNILTPSSAAGYLTFGDESHGSIGRIAYDHTNDSLDFWANNAERMVINSSGNVGIGTTTPEGRLDVLGPVSFGGSGVGFVNSGTGYQATVTGNQDKSTAITNPLLALFSADRRADDPLVMAFSVTGDPTGSNRYGSIQMSEFSTGNHRNLALNPNGGNVGIGTTSPRVTLDVNGRVHIGENNASSFLSLSPFADDGVAFISARERPETAQAGTTSLAFQVYNNNVANTAMTINNDGNVGIGTTSPIAKLHTYTTTTNTDDNTARFEAPNIGASVSHIHWGTTGDWFIRSASSSGNVVLQDFGGKVGIGTGLPDMKLHILDHHGQGIGDITASGSDLSTDWNNLGSLKVQSLNNSMVFFVDGDVNTRKGFIQVGHEEGPFSDFLGTLALNPFGGNVGIGTTTPQAELHVVGPAGTSGEILISDADEGSLSTDSLLLQKAGASAYIRNQDSAGGLFLGVGSNNYVRITSSGHTLPTVDNVYDLGSPSLHWSCLYYDATNLGTCSSDERLKDNIADLTFSNSNGTALDKLTAIQPRIFNWKTSSSTDISYGLVAQEVLNVAPELVTTDEDGYYQIRYGYLQYLTLEAIQELNDKVSALGDLTELASSSALSIDGDSTVFWTRLTNLANAFVDGVLRLGSAEITYMKAELIETEQLCILNSDGERVCVTGDELEDILDELDVEKVNRDTNNGDQEDSDTEKNSDNDEINQTASTTASTTETIIDDDTSTSTSPTEIDEGEESEDGATSANEESEEADTEDEGVEPDDTADDSNDDEESAVVSDDEPTDLVE